jgi:hypothetical protein
MKTHINFFEYVQLACQYAYLEYDLGVESSSALIFLNQQAVEALNCCWKNLVSVPDAAHLIAKMTKPS